MPAGKYNMHVEQGVETKFTVEYKNANDTPKDLTGFTGRGSIKLSHADDYTVGEFTVTVTDPTQGLVEIVLAKDALEIKLESGTVKDTVKGVYDILLENDSNGETIRLVQGTVTISPGVTQ